MYLKVTVTPDAKKELIAGAGTAHLKLSVKEPAERNLANKRVLEIVKAIYPDSKAARIVSGHRSRTKIVSW